MTNALPSRSSSLVKRHRTLLLGSALALALTGVMAPQPFGLTGPALAQSALSAPNTAQPTGFADVVEAVKPAVVGVRVKTEETVSQLTDIPGLQNLPPQFRRFFEENMPGMKPDRRRGPNQPNRRFGMSQGSGFFISADGYVVTNNHVVENASEVEVTDDAGNSYTAEVIGTDSRTDLALLKVKGNKGDFPFVKLATTEPRIGDWVVAIGNPFGLGGTVTAGIVSASGRDIGSGPYDDFLQIDAAVNRGNSGGPTFNLAGEVVGVNTAIFSPSGGNVGIAFAVPARVVSNVVDALRETGVVTRGWLGVQIQPISKDLAESLGRDDTKGALVAEVQAASPAMDAGIKAGDAIVAVNGKPVTGPRELSRLIAEITPGSETELTIWRDGKEMNVTVELGTLPDQPEMASGPRQKPSDNQATALAELGIELERAADIEGAGEEGVVVTEISSDSPLADRLQNGDIILQAGAVTIKSVKDFTDALKRGEESGKPVLCRIRSGDSIRFVAIPVKRG